MGLSKSSSRVKKFDINLKDNEHLVTLAGNPNTGKSSIFNVLTGLNQHTGNWPGKTVSNAKGKYTFEQKTVNLIDVPGTYSLYGLSSEEIVARDFICFSNSDAIIVVADATALERSLSLLFQVMEFNKKVVLAINLIDEANKKDIKINALKLEYYLGIPVILTSAKKKKGIEQLKKVVNQVCEDKYPYDIKEIRFSQEIEVEITKVEKKLDVDSKRTMALRILENNLNYFESLKFYDESTYEKIKRLINDNHNISREHIIKEYYKKANQLMKKCVVENEKKLKKDIKIDNIVTSKKFGVPIMILLLGFIFYLTISFANYPSGLLFNMFFSIEDSFYNLLLKIKIPEFISKTIVFGGYRSFAWVVSVMLPPMAIFFPLFTFFEDLGYLPRVAYNLDHHFKKCGAHGKQCLSMCMGFGCNAAGVIGTRIIDSKREKLIAILTNNFVPCNGRFPTIIAISGAFFAITGNAVLNNFIPAFSVTFLVIIGIFMTFIVSYGLSRTILKGKSSTFTLELPPYRKPKLLSILYTSLIDRTLFLLGRAVLICIPAGIITFLLANINVNNMSIMNHAVTFLNPVGVFIGLDGAILLAFILGLPANEIVLPILLMIYSNSGVMVEYESISSLRVLLLENGWTILTAINMLLFSLLHFPCSTTLMTIKKETKSVKWTLLSFIIPTVIAIVVCLITTLIYKGLLLI